MSVSFTPQNLQHSKKVVTDSPIKLADFKVQASSLSFTCPRGKQSSLGECLRRFKLKDRGLQEI